MASDKKSWLEKLRDANKEKYKGVKDSVKKGSILDMLKKKKEDKDVKYKDGGVAKKKDNYSGINKMIKKKK